MNKEIYELLFERERKILNAKDFLNTHTDARGTISKQDAATADELITEVETMTKQIHDAMSAPTTKAILINPSDSGGVNFRSKIKNAPFGVQGSEYHKTFFEEMRGGFTTATNFLRESESTRGGYLLPSEFHESIIAELATENVLRSMGKVLTTSATHKVAVLSNRPTANWIAEGARIEVSSPSFDQINLDAFKLAVGVNISNELLQDSYYDLEGFCVQEFAKTIGLAEEDAFLNGDGDGKPSGLIPAMASDSSMTITTKGASISADDLINLMHAVPRPYRKGGAWLMNDTTLANIRKLKDMNQSYMWQPSFIEGEPEKLLGYPVFTSTFMSMETSGNIAVIFGGWQYYNIAQRGELTVKPLYELNALNDISTILAIERVDAKLIDNHALRGLKIK